MKLDKYGKIGIAILVIGIALYSVMYPMMYKNSNLSSKDRQILQKHYSQLTQEEENRLCTIENDMSEWDKNKYTKELKRLYVEHMTTLGVTNPEKMWEEQQNYKERKASGKLTEKELKEEQKSDENFKENWDRTGKYLDAEKKIQDSVNKIIVNDKKFTHLVDKINIKSNGMNEEFTLTANIYRLHDLNQTDIYYIKKVLVDKTLETIKPKNIKIEFSSGKDIMNEYNYDTSKGWTKE